MYGYRTFELKCQSKLVLKVLPLELLWVTLHDIFPEIQPYFADLRLWVLCQVLLKLLLPRILLISLILSSDLLTNITRMYTKAWHDIHTLLFQFYFFTINFQLLQVDIFHFLELIRAAGVAGNVLDWWVWRFCQNLLKGNMALPVVV